MAGLNWTKFRALHIAQSQGYLKLDKVQSQGQLENQRFSRCPALAKETYKKHPIECKHSSGVPLSVALALNFVQATNGNRTRDLILTKDALYRLSHSSTPVG